MTGFVDHWLDSFFSAPLLILYFALNYTVVLEKVQG
jgi:hypothetical protein